MENLQNESNETSDHLRQDGLAESVICIRPDGSKTEYHNPEEAYWRKDEYDCAMMRLDELGVPNELHPDGDRLSIVGRINLLWRRALKAENFDREKNLPCQCCSRKVGRSFSESSFGIGPETMVRCQTCEEKQCVPFSRILMDMRMAVGAGWGKFGGRSGILRDAGCTVVKNGEYVPLFDVLNECEANIDEYISAPSEEVFLIFKAFEERDGIFMN